MASIPRIPPDERSLDLEVGCVDLGDSPSGRPERVTSLVDGDASLCALEMEAFNLANKMSR